MADHAPIFDALAALAREAAPAAIAETDLPGHLVLRGPSRDAKGALVWTAMVKTGARAVSLHLPPLYGAPHLADDLSPALTKRRQGKSCFNFTALPDSSVLKELAQLARSCAEETA